MKAGYTPFYSYTIDDTVASGKYILATTPILFEVSLPIWKRINVFLGYGYYLLYSKLDYLETTKSSTKSIGFVVAASYVLPVTEDNGLAGEIKWMSPTETRDKLLSFQLQLVWKFYKW